MIDIEGQLNAADAALTNLPDLSEAFTSAIEAARAAINSARAMYLDRPEDEEDA